MNTSFRPARRSEAKPLIGLYSESGKGKTLSALYLARGFAGPDGKVGMIETESGRGEAYADTLPGGYAVLSLRDNFSAQAYGEAIRAAEAASLQALIIDSASHEWEGKEGVLDKASQSTEKGVLKWQKPKMDHQKHFMLPLMQTPIPLVIVCMRARYPMVEKPKGTWVRSEKLEPKQADDILFEMFVHGWLDDAHRFRGTKYTRDDLKAVIRDGEPITMESGQRLAEWARGGTAAAAQLPAGGAQVLDLHPPAQQAGAAANGDWQAKFEELRSSGLACKTTDAVSDFWDDNARDVRSLEKEAPELHARLRSDVSSHYQALTAAAKKRRAGGAEARA